ncbi:hypothetical protein [uncultured Winogradskyella sp.]|jgi:cation transport ATPase|uniref:hypothetical protein n=1 Tax=uncultured Winogradskyella sp. TaxID=395353 RepID=UPI0030DCA4DC|tara:strand:+ start:2639 stop:3295 length:657 start_codon:yes stop_codon:yes gene_type:complete
MEKILDLFHSIFFDAKKTIGVRLGNFVMIVIFALVIDFCFQFTYRSFENSKLQKLERISSLKESYKSDKNIYKMLIDKENETLESQHYYNHLSSLWSSFSEYTNTQQPTINNTEIKNASPKVSIITTILSSSALFVLIIFLSFSAPFWLNNFGLKNIRESVTIGVAFTVLTAIFTSISLSIPVLFKNYIWINYILYFVIHCTVIWLIIAGNKLSKKKL